MPLISNHGSSEPPTWKRALIASGQELVQLVPSFLLITLVGGFFTQCYQARANEATLHAQEVAANRLAASELQGDLSEVLGRRLYLLQAASTRAADTGTRSFTPPEQLVASRSWFENASRYRAAVCRFFGPTETERLQALILGMESVEALRRLEHGIVIGRVDTSGIAEAIPETAGGADSLRARRLAQLDSLSGEVYLFNLALVDRISRGEFAPGAGPRCADEAFRSFERSTAPLWRAQIYLDQRDTVPRRRKRGR